MFNDLRCSHVNYCFLRENCATSRITPREILPAGKILAYFLFSSCAASSKIPVGLEFVVNTTMRLASLVLWGKISHGGSEIGVGWRDQDGEIVCQVNRHDRLQMFLQGWKAELMTSRVQWEFTCGFAGEAALYQGTKYSYSHRFL
jgi:hypothetical protein